MSAFQQQSRQRYELREVRNCMEIANLCRLFNLGWQRNFYSGQIEITDGAHKVQSGSSTQVRHWLELKVHAMKNKRCLLDKLGCTGECGSSPAC